MSELSRSRGGFSLIEAVAALAIMGAVAAAALATVSAHLSAAARAKHSAEAIVIAEEAMSNLRLQQSADLERLSQADASREIQLEAPFGEYNRSESVLSLGNGRFEISVAVRWRDGAFNLTSRTWAGQP
jgi:prepilin-type N-terminal cleavage/methylation domain-containing protein